MPFGMKNFAVILMGGVRKILVSFDNIDSYINHLIACMNNWKMYLQVSAKLFQHLHDSKTIELNV